MEDQSDQAATPNASAGSFAPTSDDVVSGWVTLFAQGAAMAAIGFVGADAWPWGIPTWIFVAVGTLIAASALPFLGRSFRIPATPNGKGLKTQGPYRWVRHPMYLGLIFVAAGLCLESRPTAWIFLAFLVLVVFAKSNLEERYMASIYPEFKEYRVRTKRLIPYIW